MHSRSRRARTTFCLLFISLFAFNFSVFAQNTSGSITGVVQDGSGAVIPGAQVKLISQEQGTARETITNEAGIYLFSALPAATYTVTAELPGFKTYKKPDVKLFDPENSVSRGCHAWLWVYADRSTGADYNTFLIGNNSPAGVRVDGARPFPGTSRPSATPGAATRAGCTST